MTRLEKGLYFITDKALSNGRMLNSVKSVLEGGAVAVQYREKQLPPRQILEEARQVKKACVDYGATFIINNSLELAQAADADGVHLGKSDATLGKARNILGGQKIIGASVSSIADLEKAAHADYLGVGPVFPTSTKPDAAPFMGLEGLAEVRGLTSKHIVAIGGIGLGNASSVLHAGADSLAVISGILKQGNWKQAARGFSKLFVGEQE
ncbi:MAG: thiamine phosphate synthase [Candidatus Micrarchaeota archaeon]